MTCEFLSGLTQLPFPSNSIVVGSGNITTAGTLYFFLTARNRAGWTVASTPVPITYPANSSITITLPTAARGLGTDFIYYSLAANTTVDPIGAYQLAQWDNYQADQITRRILNPIVLSTNEHINPAGSVALPADLPTGAALKNGMHRLIIGGIPNGATSSYYKYSQYSTLPSNLEFVLEPHPGEKWHRVGNPYTCQITNPYGTGGCAIDVRDLESNYVISPPTYDPVQANPVKGIPIKLTWRNDSTILLKAGTNFGIDIRQGAENRTDAFNGKLILTLKGYTDGLGNYDRLDAGGVNALPSVDIDRVWGYTDDALGILTLNKDLPPGESVVYEIAPYFTAQQFQGQLAPNELISTYIYPYTDAGKNVAPLWSITGDIILPVAEQMHPVPLAGAGIRVNSGSAIVQAYTFSQRPAQNIYGLTPNTADQKLCLDGNGIASIRSTPLGSEAILALISTAAGTSKVGALSTAITVAASGKVNLTLTIPNYAGDGECGIRSDYPILGGDLGDFNPPYIRVFAKSGTTIYPALSSGNSQTGVVPDYTQTIAIDSLGVSIPQPTNPADPLFGLFDPPTISGTATTGGSIPAGSYQFFAVYYYDGSTVSAIDRQSATVLEESELTLSQLFDLNQGWGRPIYNLSDLRSIDRSDTFAWQHRPVAGGSIFYYDPGSIALDDSISTFRPGYLTAIEPGRWLIRKSFSTTPAGTWNNTTTYSYLQQVTVTNDGAYLYINPVPSSGNALTNTTYWQQTSFRGAQGIQGIPGLTGAITVGTNPVTPALAASATYAVDSITGLAIGQYYAFNNVSGTLLLTALPTSTTATLQNTDAAVGSAIATGTKLLATGKTGGTGQTGATGIVGTTTAGTNPVTPALNGTATYTVTSIAGLAIGQYYSFAGIVGTFLLTALPTSTTATLQNIDATVGSAIATDTKINLSGRRGATGLTGSPLNPRGTHNPSSTYTKYDQVDAYGNSYSWASNTDGNSTPPLAGSNADWQLEASKGDTGLPGASPNFRGDYLNTNTYSKYDRTVSAGTSYDYINNTASTGNVPPNTTYWQISALKGATGEPGSPFIPRGTYSGAATYSQYEYVIFGGDGNSYWWTNPIPGNTAPPSSDWQVASLKGAPGTPGTPGTGDMNKSIYDTNNNGIVDNAELLSGQGGSYYLNRSNHSGTQISTSINDFAEAVDDRVAALLVAGANITLTYSDVTNALTIAQSVASPTWQAVSGVVEIDGSGGRFDINASAAAAILKLPSSPARNTEISYQITDTTVNPVYLEPATGDTIAAAPISYRGQHDPTIDRHLLETLRYVSGRWLPYFGRLVYESFVALSGDPYNANTVFFAIFEGANNSTTFTDFKSNSISVRSGTPKISTAQSLFGNGSLYLDGLSSLVVPAAASLVSGTQDFEWEIALYPTVFTAGNSQGLIDHRSTPSAQPEVITIRNQDGLGTIEHYDGTASRNGLAKLKLGQWQVIRICRYQGVATTYLDDVPIYSGIDTNNYTYTGNLIIGDIIDTAAPFGGMFAGYIQYIRKTIGTARQVGYGTDALTYLKPPLTDRDPLDAFKVLDINCDTGSIVDTKGHAITINGPVAVSSVQKRAGSNSIALTGGNLNVDGGTDFNFGSAPYSVHAAARFTSLGTGNTVNSPDNQYVWDFTGSDTSALLYTARTAFPGFNVSNAGAVANTYNQLPVINTWYDLELAKVGTKYLLISNNQIVAASNNAPTTVNLAALRLGGLFIDNTANLQGYIDSASVYKGIANGSNLTHSYPLRFLARFSGNSPNDELGAVGTVVGTAHTYDTTNKRSLEASALFAGTGHISYPQITAYNLESGGFELAGWLKIATGTQNSIAGLLSIGSTSNTFDNQSVAVLTSATGLTSVTGRSTTNKLSVWIGTASLSNAILCSTTTLDDGIPHYWRIIKYIIGASAATVLIVDGKIEDVYIGAYTVAATTRSLVVGSDNFSTARRFKGNCDDIAIYKA